jgi:hypothetical protein
MEEDRVTCATWRRRIVVVFYGCAAFLIFGLIVLAKFPSVAPDEVADRQTRCAGFSPIKKSRHA